MNSVITLAIPGIRVECTPEESTGPYYPAAFLDGEPRDLTRPYSGLIVAPAGQQIILSGRIVDLHGRAVDQALMEFWQADSRGIFRGPPDRGASAADTWFYGVARLYCRAGAFELKTIMPGPASSDYPGQQNRAPNITVTLFCDGINRLVTQVFFEGEADNACDPLLVSLPASLQSRLIASRLPDEGQVRRYRWDVTLRGDAETPFFDDMES
jgi:protocatechuate 3,4-dioxygenase beta subunit